MEDKKLEQILIPPQESVIVRSDEEWDKVESQLKIKLPKDYKDFISTYSTGCIDDFLWIHNPFEENENLNFFQQLEVINNAYSEMKNDFPDDFEFDVYPSNGGLLPFGSTDNGDILYYIGSQKMI